MKKKLIILTLILCLFINNPYVLADRVKPTDVNIYEKEIDLNLKSKNIILYNLSDDIKLYELNSNDKVQIASLTKIMTVYSLIEYVSDIKKEVVITEDAFKGLNGYVQAGLKTGDKVTFEDLLYGIMLPSGADCVNAAIIASGLNNDKFIKLMNDNVKKLNLKNTKFDNAIGMDSNNNYSTASDLATILMNALKNETFKKIYTTKKYTMKNGLKLHSTLLSYGGTLNTDNIKGAKSGFTDGAGVCLSSIAEYNKTNYLLIVLGASTSSKANAVKDSVDIYNYYDKNYSYKKIFTKNQVLTKLNIKWGKEKKYIAQSNKDIEIYLDNSIEPDDIEYDYKGIKELNYKIKKGDKLGKVTAKYNDKVLTTYDVYLNKKIEYYHPLVYTIVAITIIGLISLYIKIKKKKKKRKKRKKKRKKK